MMFHFCVRECYNFLNEHRPMKRKTKEQISYNMRQVKSKGSQIEVTLMKELWKRGLRYRKNCRNIYGNPDLAFIKQRVAIFIDSEFWHGYDWQNRKMDFKTNQSFWWPKIERNIARDSEVNEKLCALGWTVLRFWGKEIKTKYVACADKVEFELRKKKYYGEFDEKI